MFSFSCFGSLKIPGIFFCGSSSSNLWHWYKRDVAIWQFPFCSWAWNWGNATRTFFLHFINTGKFICFGYRGMFQIVENTWNYGLNISNIRNILFKWGEINEYCRLKKSKKKLFWLRLKMPKSWLQDIIFSTFFTYSWMIVVSFRIKNAC